MGWLRYSPALREPLGRSGPHRRGRASLTLALRAPPGPREGLSPPSPEIGRRGYTEPMIVSQLDADPGWRRRRVMSALPGRPDLDQLRPAAAGDEQALARIRVVSQQQTLSAAQLAIARESGFVSWPRLRAEVLRRQGGTEPDGAAVAVAETPSATDSAPKSWQEMREWCARLLQARTGQGVAAWKERIAAATPQNRASEPALRTWLSAEGVTGYAQAVLVWETLGYPGFLVADAEELIGKQYGDRPQLRPVFDAVLGLLPALPGPVTVQARGTLVSLVSPRRTFAVLKPTTKSRVDLGLRLDTTQPEGRILPARDLGQATVRIPLATPGEVDDEVRAWL